MKNLYPWQHQQWQQLLSQHRQQRLPHALLLSGVPGLGKLAFAQQVAQYLLCKTVAGGQACGACSGCRLILANNHPDLLNIAPEERDKNIKIEQIRNMILTLNQTALRTGYQVAIISPAEALNKAAANALLKTLEEPAGRVVLLLVTDQPGALPATIVSRCQQIRFSGQPGAKTWLTEQLVALSIPADSDLLLKIAEYAPLRALELAQNNYLALRDQLLTHLVAIGKHQVSPIVPVPEYLKQDLRLWVNAFISLIADVLRLHLSVDVEGLTNQDCLPQLQVLAKIYSLVRLLPLWDALIRARRALLSNQIHLNEQLLLESLLIQA